MAMKLRVLVVSGVWCTLTALPVQAEVSIGPQMIITGTTIEILEPGPDIHAIIDDIDDASSGSPYLIELGPGTYDIGTTRLEMKSYVSIRGAGQEVTHITGAVSTASSGSISAVIVVQNDSDVSLSDFSISNTGGSSYSHGIYIEGASPIIRDLTAGASGGSMGNWGIEIADESAPVLTNVTSTGTGGMDSWGVYDNGTNGLSRTVMTNVTAKGSGGSDGRGLSIWGPDPVMTNVTATGHGISTGYGAWISSSPRMTNVTATGEGGTASYGVWISGSPRMTNVTAIGSGALTINYGVFNSSSDDSPRIENSSLEGSTGGMRFHGSDIGTRISNTRIVGGIANNPTGIQCRDTFDENLTNINC